MWTVYIIFFFVLKNIIIQWKLPISLVINYPYCLFKVKVSGKQVMIDISKQ